MIRIIVLLHNKVITEINSITKSNNDNQIKNIVVRTLPRRNIILNNELNKKYKLEKCYNCNNIANYILDYDIKYENDIIYFNCNLT